MRDLSNKPFYGVIKEYEHWVVLFREKQVTVGSVIIMSKQLKARGLGELPVEAWTQFGEVCRDVEAMITRVFGAEKFNYLALMMVDPEVHFHVIPRYSKPVRFAGLEFIDADWPKATQRVALDIPEEIRRGIEHRLKEYWNTTV